MKKVLSLVLLLCFAQIAKAEYVQGYYRQDGTYVNSYHRTSSNHTQLDNYSTKGNYNPYTGQSGTVDPYKNTNAYNSNNNSYSNQNYQRTNNGLGQW